ncbi:MAG: hypothetical protein WC979_09685 [Candidatus Pacearchaeota archaeon]|jgi:hypothetical protein
MNEEIERLHKRQLARLLSHLEKTGQLTPALAQDMKRAYGFVFEDIKNLLTRHSKESRNDNSTT